MLRKRQDEAEPSLLARVHLRLAMLLLLCPSSSKQLEHERAVFLHRNQPRLLEILRVGKCKGHPPENAANKVLDPFKFDGEKSDCVSVRRMA
jgi:hypothetical protein